MFEKYMGQPLDLHVVDNELLELAKKHQIPNPKSIHEFGIEGLIKPQSNGFYTGVYYYGGESDFIGISFSILLDRVNINYSNIMISKAMLVKENEIIHNEKIK